MAEARTLRAAHVNGDLDAHMLDLALYEIGNVLLRALHWDPADVADQLDDLLAIVGRHSLARRPGYGGPRCWGTSTS